MNQILSTTLNKKIEEKNLPNKRKFFFKTQFILSIFAIMIIIFSVSYSYYKLNSSEKLSDQFINYYHISQLYANNTQEYKADGATASTNNLFGIIEIPKINIYYPVFSTLSDELLKISPCKFYGGSLTEYSNICIAGHNYNNSLFFSNLASLDINDPIYIYDNYGKKYTYIVSSLYEVTASDLTPIFEYSENSKELTLITCNNFNSNRFIVKASQLSE